VIGFIANLLVRPVHPVFHEPVVARPSVGERVLEN
jgi:hypothetical protein